MDEALADHSAVFRHGALAFVLCLAVWTALLVSAIRRTHRTAKKKHQRRSDGSRRTSMTVLLGSGGHTAEMLRLVEDLPTTRYSPRLYIVSSGDSTSVDKVRRLERCAQLGSDYSIAFVPRARRVHQSYLSSVLTTALSLIVSQWRLAVRPALSRTPRGLWHSDLLLLNGPGTCIPVAMTAFLPRLVGLPSPTIVYVESWARAKRLSLTALLLRPFVDRFVVQWPDLKLELEGRKGSVMRRMGLVGPINYAPLVL